MATKPIAYDFKSSMQNHDKHCNNAENCSCTCGLKMHNSTLFQKNRSCYLNHMTSGLQKPQPCEMHIPKWETGYYNITRRQCLSDLLGTTKPKTHKIKKQKRTSPRKVNMLLLPTTARSRTKEQTHNTTSFSSGKYAKKNVVCQKHLLIWQNTYEMMFLLHKLVAYV